jgi:predicted lipoprotein with Yx(FWY)xxD motif
MEQFSAVSATEVENRRPNLLPARAVDRSTEIQPQGAFMRQFANPRSKPLALRFALLALALSALLVPALAGAAKSKTVAKLADSAAFDKPIVTNLKGRTLYTLSSEKTKFVCVDACLDAWPPLIVPAGVKPKGPVPLSTKKRPDGRTQVTWKGFPLYTFSGDSKPGDTNGEGIRGGGVWHVAQAPQVAKETPTTTTPPPASTTPPPPSNPYGY